MEREEMSEEKKRVTVTASDVSALRNRVAVAMHKGEAPSAAAMEIDHLLRRWFSELVQREDRRTEQIRQKNDPKKEEDEPPRLSTEKEHQDPRTEIQKKREAFRLSLDKLEADAKVENHLKDLRQLVELGCSFLCNEVRLMEENGVHNTRDRVFTCYDDEKVPKNNQDRVFRHYFQFKSEGMSPEIHERSQRCGDDVKEQEKKRWCIKFAKENKEIQKNGSKKAMDQIDETSHDVKGKQQKEHQNSERNKTGEATTIAMELDDLLDNWYHDMQQTEPPRFGVPVSEEELGSSKRFEEESIKTVEKASTSADIPKNMAKGKRMKKRLNDNENRSLVSCEASKRSKHLPSVSKQSTNPKVGSADIPPEKPSTAVVTGKRRRAEAAGGDRPKKRPDTSKSKNSSDIGKKETYGHTESFSESNDNNNISKAWDSTTKETNPISETVPISKNISMKDIIAKAKQALQKVREKKLEER